MPDVTQTIRSFRRRCKLLLAFCLAFAVSHLFSVLPFGNATSGYMAPIPAPALQVLDSEQPHWAAEASVLSDVLTWQGNCEVLWAALSTDSSLVDHWAFSRAHGLSLDAAPTELPAATAQRAPPCGASLDYHLRAPPRLA